MEFTAEQTPSADVGHQMQNTLEVDPEIRQGNKLYPEIAGFLFDR